MLHYYKLYIENRVTILAEVVKPVEKMKMYDQTKLFFPEKYKIKKKLIHVLEL